MPVGEQKKPLMEGMRYIKEINRIYLIATKDTYQVAIDIQEKLQEIYEEIYIIKTSPFNLDVIVQSLIDEVISKNHGKHIISNITGGTKIMSLACYILTSLYEGDVFYIFKGENNEMQYVEAPALKVDLRKVVSYGNKRYYILKKLENKDYNVIMLANDLNIKSSTLNGHISKLVKHDLVRTRRDGREVKISITNTGKLFYKLVSLDGKKDKKILR